MNRIMGMANRGSMLALLGGIALSLYGCASVARHPDPRLEFARGMNALQGNGSAEARAAGLKWIRRAAHQDLAMAQDQLGLMYLYGSGMKQSSPRALEWIRRAAERGAPAAQLQLGSLYSTGNCVRHDDVRAYYWFSVAARDTTSSIYIYNIVQVRDFALRWARTVAEGLTAAQIAAVDQRAADWTPTPSIPYSGAVMLSHWSCVRPEG